MVDIGRTTLTRQFTLFVLTVVTLFGITSCVNYRPVILTPEGLAENIEPGDRVRIETVDGHVTKTRVLEVSERGIKGKRQEFPIDDLRRVEKGELSKIKTAWLIWGIVTLTGGIYGLHVWGVY